MRQTKGYKMHFLMFATSTLPLLSLYDFKPVQTAHSFVNDDLN